MIITIYISRSPNANSAVSKDQYEAKPTSKARLDKTKATADEKKVSVLPSFLWLLLSLDNSQSATSSPA
jgi:hypothetical protein